MLNKIWPAFLIISFIYAILNGNIEEFNNTIYTCTNIIANLSNLIEPIMPQTSKRLREYLKIERPLWKQIQIKEKISLGNIEILFERIDINKNR